MPIMPFDYNYNRPGRFRFWSQHILPIVYDDSLSYYEVLCKLGQAIHDLYDAMENDFKDILIQFFNNIMPTVMYEEENERIVFSFTFSAVVADGMHLYTQNDETMEIIE